MFGDNEFGDILFAGIDLIFTLHFVISVDEHHQVRVLFNSARFTQVGKFGPVAIPLFNSARKLGDSDNRDV